MSTVLVKGRASEPARPLPRRGPSPNGHRGDWPWLVALGLIASVACFTNGLAFWPGFMSEDSVDQLTQARSGNFTDWHPPILALLWRGLILLTGTVGSMLVVQLLVEWFALFALSALVFRSTGSRRWSLAALSIGLLPFIVNISGVIWKDVHLAFALLAATVIALWLPELRKRRLLFWCGVALAVLLLAYAVMVRKNAIVAVLPLLVVLYHAWPGQRRIRAAGLALALVLTIVALQGMVSVIARPSSSGMSQFIAVDDIVHTMSETEIREAGFSSDLQRRLLTAQEVCHRDGVIFNAYISCYPREEGIDHGAEIQDRWVGLMAERPFGYAVYRTQAFSTYLFSYRLVWMEGIVANPYDIVPRVPGLAASLRMYVQRTDTSLGIVFVPAFWLLISVLLLAQGRTMTRYGQTSRMLGLSSFLYIVAYFPVVPAVDYRYTYWPALACCVAGLLLAIERTRSEPPRVT